MGDSLGQRGSSAHAQGTALSTEGTSTMIKCFSGLIAV